MQKPYKPMKGKKKQPKLAGFMRSVLAANVRALMDRQYPLSGNKPMRLAKDAAISLSSVQRILNKDVGASLDNIESLASALEVTVYQLLIPNLDAANPQVVQGAAEKEKLLYSEWRRHDLRQQVPMAVNSPASSYESIPDITSKPKRLARKNPP